VGEGFSNWLKMKLKTKLNGLKYQKEVQRLETIEVK